MTVDPQLLCEARTEKLAAKVADLERVCRRLNGLVSDLMVLYTQAAGRELPPRFGQHHWPNDLGERRPMTYSSRSDRPESTEPTGHAQDTQEVSR